MPGFPISEQSMRSIYEMLIQMQPISRWRLPPSKEVEFAAVNDPLCYGEFEPPNVIRLSRKKIGHLDTAIKTMAHEIVHLKRYQAGDKAWDKHDERFDKMGLQISLLMGFDPKEF